MPEPRHTTLRRLFDQALELPPTAREAFVAERCRGDEALQRRLLAMLAAAADEQFLAAPTGPQPAAPAAATAAVPEEGIGSRIGPYRLLQQLGEGGFGLVFLAQQDQPVERQVALKIVKLGMDTRQVVARFEQERQALALMDHPHIARVLDAGATATGRPFFVMDLVKGLPIVDYCDRNHLPIEARLELFAQVCSAVQHAHSKGIIHRDLKPSNVLVATQDGRPQAKVIDFGIAKATAQRLTDKTLFTEHQQVIGTLQYMSPEQAEGSPDIDTRSDVYSLGVLLYELLTGSTPFDKKTVRGAMFGELQRLIREVDPPRPSTRLDESRDTLASIAAQRRTEPRRLGSLIRGDLDWIVMKAIEKDRSRRYETATGLALDIRRHLNGEAVVAAPPSASYRLRKFVRKNRGTVAALAAVAASLLLGVVLFAWQAEIARRERNDALAARQAEATQRELAEARSSELQLVATFQERMLGQLDATAAGIRLMDDLRARHRAALAASAVPEVERDAVAATFAQELARANATDTAAAMVDTAFLTPATTAVGREFAQQPLVEATLRQTLAKLYDNLGRFDTALGLQRQTTAARVQRLGEGHLDTARARQDLAVLLEKVGRFAEAEAEFRAALAVRRAQLGDAHPDTCATLGGLGGNLRFQGKLAEAEPLLVEALAVSRRVLGAEHRETLIRTNVLGFLRIDQGRVADAEPLWREAYTTGLRVFGADDPDVITWTNNLGGLLGTMGKAADAERHYREAWTAAIRVHGAHHPNTLNCASNVASVLGTQGRFAEAEAIERETLAARTRLLGPDHPDTLQSLSLLGGTLMRQSRFAEAEPLLRNSFTGRQRTSGATHAETLRAGAQLADLLNRSGQPAPAEALFRELLATSAPTWGPDHPDRLVMQNNLGNLLVREGRREEAEPLLRATLAARQRVSGPDHPETLVAASNYGRLREDQGQLQEAEAIFRDATARFRRVLGDGHPNTLHSCTNLSGVLLAQQRFADAEPLAREAVAGYARIFGPDHLTTAGGRRLLGRALAGLQRFAAAETELLAAATAISGAPSASVDRKRSAVRSVVALYEAWQQAAPAPERAAALATWQAKLAELPPPRPADGK